VEKQNGDWGWHTDLGRNIRVKMFSIIRPLQLRLEWRFLLVYAWEIDRFEPRMSLWQSKD
jgi:hypothetical protein